MVRAPCCEKMGLKRGHWSPEEDHILISYIQRHGHGNWRALPKQAGLLRCGKSCRLRWINYLRPDIKRGNFSLEEEKTIIKLHEMLGNRWSAIAATLPGRTDNEIKNVWHTHLKKRLAKKSNHENVVDETQKQPKEEPEDDNNVVNVEERPVSSAQSSSTSDDNNNDDDDHHHHHNEVNNESAYKENELDDDFWLEVFSSSNDSPGPQIQSPLLEGSAIGYEFVDLVAAVSSNMYNNDNDIDFRYDAFAKGGDVPEWLAQM